MATNTYVALDKITTTGSTANVTFSSINQGYTDLVLVVAGTLTSSSSVYLQFNSDTATNYSRTYLQGNGSTATSGRDSSQNYMALGYLNSSAQGNTTFHIQNYSNATTYKTVLCRAGVADDLTRAMVGLWRSTAAVSSILVSPVSGNFATGTTFSLYGIKAEGTESTPKASGGYVYSDSTYYYHAFLSSGTFTPSQSLSCDILAIAGGGGGGGKNLGGGGGAGGLLYTASQSLTATGYTVTVGAGGAGQGNVFTAGGNGGNSQFGSVTASVGGGGGAMSTSTVGSNGGSGGGGSNGTPASSLGGTATSGQGYAGGGGGNTYDQGGGGGGSGAVGQTTASPNYVQLQGGAGINTYSSWASATGTGVAGYYAGGGHGGIIASNIANQFVNSRSLGGGGTTLNPNAVANTGSGGVGFSYDGGAGTYPGGNGGSGLVIVRYAK